MILTNPRYAGRQVWNKQRTDEVLLDVNDVAMGHVPVMRWNPSSKWVVSNDIVHEPLVADEGLGLRARESTARKPPCKPASVHLQEPGLLRGLRASDAGSSADARVL